MALNFPLAGPARNLLALPTDPIWRFSVEQYHKMILAGILTDDDPVELLEGWLIITMPKNPAHRLCTQLAREALAQRVPGGWFVDAQEPITTQDSEPEPDLVVVRGDRRQYRDRHPGPQDVALVAGVSDTTLQRDRTLKKRLYARAAIPVYWIINLVDRLVEVYREPVRDAEEPDYQQRQDYRPADLLPLQVDGREYDPIPVSDLLP